MDNLLARITIEAARFVESIDTTWVLVQIALIAAAVGLAHLLNRRLEPLLEGRIRKIRNRPGLLRLLAAALRRTRWILAAALLWAIHVGLGQAALAEEPRLVGLVAALVTAWAGIAIAARVIRNRVLARIVAVGAWIVVALTLLDLRAGTATMLDRYAFTIGAFRLSALALIQGLALLAFLLWLASLVSHALERSLRDNPDVTPSLRVLFAKLAKIALVAVAIVSTFSVMGLDLTTITVVSGALGLGIGFGLQKVVSNLVSGIIILADKSIKPGDVIEVGETFGWIRSLRARFVSVVTRDGREYLIPNEDFVTQRVVNWSFTDDLVRLDVHFGVAYDCDPHAVRRLAIEAAKSVPRVREDPHPICHLEAFGESSLDFNLRFWIDDPAAGLSNVRGAVLLACWDAFKENGVTIPYPHREVIVRRKREGETTGGRRRAPKPDG